MSTENLPTEPGYYWHRDVDPGCGEAFEWEVRKVFRHIDDKKVLVSESCDGTRNLPISEFKDCEWGPRIPDPEELQEKAETDKALDAAIKRSVQTAHNQVRDSLALAALPSCIMLWHDRGQTYAERAVQAAYEYADAMLEARK